MMKHFCPPEFGFKSHFVVVVVEHKVSGPPYVVKLWLSMIRTMLLIRYFSCSKYITGLEFNEVRMTSPGLRLFRPLSFVEGIT